MALNTRLFGLAPIVWVGVTAGRSLMRSCSQELARLPSRLRPPVFNKLQQLHADVRHRLSSRLAASFSYLYEPLRIYDFAFDPSVVNGIAQPSSLVMGYVYRPYTAHSAVFGLMYYW